MRAHPTPSSSHSVGPQVSPVRLPIGPLVLAGDLVLPATAQTVVLFAHGSGSSRLSPRNQFVAQTLQEAGIGTLLFDLLTAKEENEDARDGHVRFDIPLLAGRLQSATRWITEHGPTRHFGIGYFGASTGGAAALVAASRLGASIGAVVSRGGRPDLAGPALPRIVSPTLLIVGGRDDVVLRLNEEARTQMRCKAELVVVPGATHLFEEPGTLKQVATLAAEWFQQHLKSQ